MLTRRLANGLLLLVAGTTLAACASSSPTGRDSTVDTPAAGQTKASSGVSNDAPVRVTPSAKPAVLPAGECGRVPTSAGPLAHLARLTVAAPSAAAAGATVALTVTISATTDAPRMITTPASSAVLVVQNGRVVGRARGVTAPEVPLQLTSGVATPAQAIPKNVRLDSCASGAGALAAGSYSLVAVLGYRADPMNSAPNDGDVPQQAGGQPFVLVSAPARITVT